MYASSLTKHPLGSFKELMTLSLPITLSLLSACLMSLCDRFFLARYSLEALKACGGVAPIIFLFQIPCMRICSISQVFVGQYQGAQMHSKVGEMIWQMIWFSLLSMVLTLPLSFCVAHYFFSNTAIRELGTPYFFIFMGANFLYPLGTTLSSFFIGQGRTSTVTFIMVLSLALHIYFDYALIFGIPNTLPALGMRGAAYATIFSQAFYCLVLFILFLRRKERCLYRTDLFHLNWPLLKSSMALGAPQAVSRLSVLAAWAAAVKILTNLGDDYLMVLSTIGSLYTFFSCLTQGMGQGLITAISYLIGGEKRDRIRLPIRSACLLLTAILGCLAIFLFLYPKQLIVTFFSSSFTQDQLRTLVLSCYGLWMFFLWEGISWIGLSILTAFGDTRFLMFYNATTSWCFTFLPIYLAFGIMQWTPTILGCLMAIPCFASAIAYLFRIRSRLHLYSNLLA